MQIWNNWIQEYKFQYYKYWIRLKPGAIKTFLNKLYLSWRMVVQIFSYMAKGIKYDWRGNKHLRRYKTKGCRENEYISAPESLKRNWEFKQRLVWLRNNCHVNSDILRHHHDVIALNHQCIGLPCKWCIWNQSLFCNGVVQKNMCMFAYQCYMNDKL